MPTFIAHYKSPNASMARAMGMFEFESEARLGTKAIAHDARMKMLETYGKEAVSWNVEKIERKKEKRVDHVDGQLELDFRTPAPERKRAKKKEYW